MILTEKETDELVEGLAEAVKQHAKNESYFECICEALNIDDDSTLVEILSAIEKLKGK